MAGSNCLRHYIWRMSHELYMKRCLELASLGAGSVAPNPMVGCVVVHDGRVIGEGYHQKFGEAHAEVNAIRSVGEEAPLAESTIYVNLEPCTHHGKTPPCLDLILTHKPKAVVIANGDPYKEVAGRGIRQMREAGIEVIEDVLVEEGRWLNRRFFTFHEQKRPYIILKWAQTIDAFLDHERSPGDGKTALKITGTEADRLVHQWRAEEMAIMVGKNTAMLDDPGLTVRHVRGNDPLRIVVDPQLQLTPGLKLFTDGKPTWVYNSMKAYCEGAVCYEHINDPEEFPREIASHLFHNDIQSLIIEGGAETISRFYSRGLWDEARIFTGMQRIGSGVRAPAFTGIERSTTRVGNEILQVYTRV